MDIFFILKRYHSAVHLKPSPSTSLLTPNQVEKPATIGTATGIKVSISYLFFLSLFVY